VAEGVPTLLYIVNHQGSGGGLVANVLLIVVYLFFLLPLWVAGVVSLVRSALLRPLGIACLLPLVLFLFVGKSYYAVGTVPLVLAQGLMAIARLTRPRLASRLQIGVVIAAALEFLVFLPLTLPITPPNRIHAAGLDTKNELFADSVGWDDVAHQVQRIYGDLPRSARRHTIIISAYYGVPGALRVYGEPQRLPPVVSPQLSAYYWLPRTLAAADALMIDYQPAEVSWMCTAPQTIAHLTVPYGVTGLEQGAPVTFCRLTLPVSRAWGRLRNFS
jgi:hypothetical protein